jgi:hypothetical protein
MHFPTQNSRFMRNALSVFTNWLLCLRRTRNRLLTIERLKGRFLPLKLNKLVPVLSVAALLVAGSALAVAQEGSRNGSKKGHAHASARRRGTL